MRIVARAWYKRKPIAFLKTGPSSCCEALGPEQRFVDKTLFTFFPPTALCSPSERKCFLIDELRFGKKIISSIMFYLSSLIMSRMTNITITYIFHSYELITLRSILFICRNDKNNLITTSPPFFMSHDDKEWLKKPLLPPHYHYCLRVHHLSAVLITPSHLYSVTFINALDRRYRRTPQ